MVAGGESSPASTVECCAELGSYLGDVHSAARPDWKSRELSAGRGEEGASKISDAA